MANLLSYFLIKNSGEPLTALSLLLCAVRGCSIVEQLKQSNHLGRRVSPPTGLSGAEKAARRLVCERSGSSEPKPAMLASSRRPCLFSHDVGIIRNIGLEIRPFEQLV